MVYLVFRSIKCHAVLVPVPTSSLHSTGRVRSSIQPPAAQVRLGLELIEIRFVKINLTYNLTLNKCNPNRTLTKFYLNQT